MGYSTGSPRIPPSLPQSPPHLWNQAGEFSPSLTSFASASRWGVTRLPKNRTELSKLLELL